MPFVIAKPDLDTCLSALILGADSTTVPLAVPGRAAPWMLADPAYVCLECGGSGQMHLADFDHHDPARDLPPACRQALAAAGGGSPELVRLVDYVAEVDIPAWPRRSSRPKPSLSALFSGMLLRVGTPVGRFQAGLGLLETVRDLGLDPFEAMPVRPEWSDFLAARQAESEALQRDAGGIVIRELPGGLRLGGLATRRYGAVGAIFSRGCRLAVALQPGRGEGEPAKATIAGAGLRVDWLLAPLSDMEPGWGGRQDIIGSPVVGTRLPLGRLLDLVASQAGFTALMHAATPRI